MARLLVLSALAGSVAGYATPAMTRPQVAVRGPVRCDGPAMQQGCSVTVEPRPKSAVALDITISESLSKEVQTQVVGKLAKSANIPGFRKGKVPPQAVITHLGMKKVKSAVVEQLIDVGMQQSGSQVRLHTVGEARLEEDIEHLEERYEVGKEVSFKVLVDVYPQIPLTEETYGGLEVSIPDVEFNQDAYDAALTKLRDQHADLIDAEDGAAAAEGEQLTVNMDGFFKTADGSKGEALPSVAGGEGVQVPLTPGKFMHGLVEGLIGVKKGEVRSITVMFPERTSAPQLAGKEAIFEVTCLNVQRKVLAEANDEFANKVKEGMSWKELDEKLREGVENEMEERKKALTHQELQKALVEKCDFDVPETLMDQVAKERFAMMLADMREKGATDDDLKEIISPDNYERFKKISLGMTEAQVKGDFALKHIGQQQGLVVSRDAIDEEVMTLQRGALQRGEKFKESDVRPKVEAQLEKDMVLNWLETRAVINTKAVDVDEVDEVSAALGASPEELAARLATEEAAAAAAADDAAESKSDAPPPPAPDAAPEPASDAAPESAPDGYSWGGTF